MAFTSHSSQLGAMLRNIHVAMGEFLRLESVPKAQTQGIKCLALLISNSPYQRLAPGTSRLACSHLTDTDACLAFLSFDVHVVLSHESAWCCFVFPGYISSAIKLLIPLLDGSKDYDVRVAVLTCIGTIFEASLRPDELDEWVGPRPAHGSHGAAAVAPVVDAGSAAVVTESESSAVVNDSAASDTTAACPGYLVDRVLLAAETVSQPVVVKVEAMQALCKLIDTHPMAALPALPRAIVMAKTCATDTDGSLRLHAAKVGVVW